MTRWRKPLFLFLMNSNGIIDFAFHQRSWIMDHEIMKTKITQMDSPESFTMMRCGKKLSDMDRSFDMEYWQRQGDAAIFNAAWELVEIYMRDRGMAPDECRLQRTVENFQRKRS